MICIWEEVPNSEDGRGWRKTRCQRCKRETAPWPKGTKHHRECDGKARWHDFGYWLEWPLEMVFIDNCRYRWLKARLGLQPRCNCQQRAESANRCGAWLAKIASKFWR